MINLLTVIGARPQIIKAAAFSRAVKRHNDENPGSPVREWLLHTGQHYDENMSGVFFGELGIPQPDFNLGVGSGSHGQQTAAMIAGIEKVLLEGSFDGVVLYGDTNSTLAGAVAASKLHIPVYHIEAGLRSFNMTMPEEVNRLVCDRLSHLLFAPTQTAVDNLTKEGYAECPARFADGRSPKVVKSGDVMYDNSLYFSSMAPNIPYRDYVLATIHRPANTDNPDKLRAILEAFAQIPQTIVWPVHPRTRKVLPSSISPNVKLIEPASFLGMIALEKNADLVMTDSGGVQKEAFFFGKPCVILRPETEWVEIVEHGAGILADSDTGRILDAYRELRGRKVKFPPLFGDSHAAEHILACILENR